MALRALLALALFFARLTAASDDPRAVVRHATHQVESDSAAVAMARARARLARSPGDRGAQFELATLARLTYDYPTADRLFSALVAPEAPRDRFMAYAWMGLGATNNVRGNAGAAEQAFQNAFDLAVVLDDSAARAQTLITLGQMRGRRIGPAAELKILDQADSLIPVREYGLAASARCERAAIAARTGTGQTVTLALQGVALADRSGEPRLRLTCLAIMATDLTRTGPVDSAYRMFERQARQGARLHDVIRIAGANQWLGSISVDHAQYGQAHNQLTAALDAAERSGFASAHAWGLVNRAKLFLVLGDLTSAGRDADSATARFGPLGDMVGRSVALGLQGEIDLAAGDTAGARATYASALQLAETMKDRSTIVYVHSMYIQLAMRENDWAGARRELAVVDQLLAQAGQTEGRGAANMSRALISLHEGDYDAAEREFKRHVEKLDAEQGGERFATELLLANVSLRRGDTAAAIAGLQRASNTLDTWRASLSDPDQRLLAFQVRSDPDGRPPPFAPVIAAGVASGRVQAAFDLAERRRARQLLSQLLQADAMRVDTIFRLDRPRPRTDFGAPVAISPDSLPRGVALLEYVAEGGGSPTTLFVITPHSLRAYVLAPEDSLIDDIERAQALNESGGDPRVATKRLGAALLHRALNDLPAGTDQLVIIPDDELHHVSFAEIPTGDGRLLVERYAVSVAPSASVLAALWRRPAPNVGGVLAFANPKFADPRSPPPSAVAATFRDAFAANGGLGPLPASLPEARSAAILAPRSVVRTGEGASEVYLKTTPLAGFAVIHFATHALVDERSIAHTALALAPGGGEDGFVTPADLAALRIDATLVVLSSCRSAGGVLVRGEGVEGLTSPLLASGARAVLASGWAVGDRDAERFMAGVYRELAKGATVGEAVRAAELAALKRGESPRTWAAFTVVGDPLVRVTAPPRAGTGR